MKNVIERIFVTGTITREEQNWLCKAMLYCEALSYDDNQKIIKLNDFVRRGFIKVID